MKWIQLSFRATRFCAAHSWKLAPVFWPILIFQLVANREKIREGLRTLSPLLNGLKPRPITPLLRLDDREGVAPRSGEARPNNG